MESELITRLIWALAIILAGALGYRLVTQLVLNRAARNSLPGGAQKTPTLLYFTTPDCQPCRTVQRPAIHKIQQELGEKLEVIEINAQADPETARAWGVLSVPTTFILDGGGKPVHVNHGVATAEKLFRQIKPVLS